METITTKDNSVTLRHTSGEAYHATAGAKEEVIRKFVEIVISKDLSAKKKIVVLDFCFGFGYKTAGFLEAMKDFSGEILVFGLEIDRSLVEKIQELPDIFSTYPLIKRLIKENPLKKNNVTIKLIYGDARETIDLVDAKVDVCSYDPFSLKVCPELWSYECFKKVYDKMNPGGILTTYSCARLVRDNMKKAGFTIKDGPIIGRRGPSTIAVK